MPSTRYIVSTSQFALVSDVPCLLQGITIHEANLAAVNYSICDVAISSLENVVMVIRSISGQAVHISFPLPIYFSRGLYIESAGSIPLITVELL